ncbi:hypothetical protein MAL04_20060 (plasmid) [Leptospira noguchii]|nr:hypothetical protein MAL04_20060 [Leptospira noguchii]
MKAHTHMGFGGYQPTEANYNKSTPYWDYSVIILTNGKERDDNSKNYNQHIANRSHVRL